MEKKASDSARPTEDLRNWRSYTGGVVKDAIILITDLFSSLFSSVPRFSGRSLSSVCEVYD